MEVTQSANVLVLAGIAAASGLLSPILLAMLNARQQRRKEDRDYARLDLVAKRADERADKLAVQTRQVAAETQSQLRQIHILVNSNLTQEMEARLVALDAQLVLTNEVMRLNAAAGREPNEAAQAAMGNLKRTAEGLRTSLKERAIATDAAADQRAAT